MYSRIGKLAKHHPSLSDLRRPNKKIRGGPVGIVENPTPQFADSSGTSSNSFGGPRALCWRFHGGSQAPRDFKIRSMTSSWRGEVRAEITRISWPQEAHKLGSASQTLAINLAQFFASP